MIPITCNAVGDILALATLVLDIARALKESGGSASDYRAFIGELNSLHIVLASISRVAEHTTDIGLRTEIVCEVDRCVKDMQRALERVAKFSDLGRARVPGDAMRVKLKRNWYKLEWRFGHRGKVQEVRTELAAATHRLTTYLVISNADRMENLRESLSKQFNTSLANMCTSLVESFAATTVRSTTQHATTRGPSDSADHTRVAAVAILCLAVCTVNEMPRAAHTALLLAAICLLMRGMGQQELLVSHTVSYSSENSVTLHDAIGRQLVLPFELCETREIFHDTLVNLFASSPGRWFIDNRKYQVTRRHAHERYLVDWRWEGSMIQRGAELEMDVIVQHAVSQDSIDFLIEGECPWCFAMIEVWPVFHGSTPHLCVACGRNSRVGCPAYVDNEESEGARSVEDQGLYPRARPTSRLDYSIETSELSRNAESVSQSISGFDSLLNQDNTGTIHDQSWQMLTGHFTRVSISSTVVREPMGSYLVDAFPVSKNRCGLHRAAENGHLELVAALLGGGANIDAHTTSGHTALHLACYNGHVNVVELLLERGAAIDQAARFDVTPLASAIVCNRYEVSSVLLSRGAIVDAPEHIQAVVLHAAALRANMGVVHLLLRLGADVNARFLGNGSTVLLAAVVSGSSMMVETLLQHGADVRQCREALSRAASMGSGEIFELLASGGVIEDQLQFEKAAGTPGDLLYDAAYPIGNRTIIERILDAGADVNMRFRDGHTLLSRVLAGWCTSDCLWTVRFLLSRRANPNTEVTPRMLHGRVEKQKSWNVLHDMARCGLYEIVEVLLQHGADVNARSEFGATPLSLAMVEMEGYYRATSPEWSWLPAKDRAQKVEDLIKTVKVLLASGAVSERQ